MFRLARQVGIPAVLDAEAPFDGLEETLALATHVAFSAPGLAAYTGLTDHAEALRSAAQHLDAWFCVTDGARGAWYRRGEEAGHVSAIRVDAVDTLGAGDVWHGAFALAIGEGRSEVDATPFANAAAALKCRNGTGWQAIAGRNDTLALAAAGGN